MSTIQSGIQSVLYSCGSDSFEKQKKSIDLSTNITMSIMDIAEIVIIAKLNRA